MTRLAMVPLSLQAGKNTLSPAAFAAGCGAGPVMGET
jgi:hypothetical protein